MLLYLDTLIGFAVVMLVISLLITILTQAVSALLNHRGGNLRWGLKALFEHIDPGAYAQLAANANGLAHEVLRHDLISDSWFSDNKVMHWFAGWVPGLMKLFGRLQLASAIRPNELVSILRQIASRATPPGVLADLPAAAWAGLQANITALLAAPNPDATREMNQAAGVAAAAVAAIPAQAATALLQDSVNAVRNTAGNLEAWFGSIMDRVAQKFAMYMRLWTVLFACAFAFGSGLNSIVLISDLYGNATLRNALVGGGQQISGTAATVLDSQNTLAAKFTASLQKALQNANIAAPQPPAIQTTAAGIAWIQANVPAAQVAAVTADFNSISTAASQQFIQDLAQNATTVISASSKAGFDVLKFRWPANWWAAKFTGWGLGYFGGVLITAALLSLGAPFWFNALKSMTNLRPILASKEKSEQTA
jgi:hypothetical protein